MRTRALDQNGDMMPCLDVNELITGAPAVAQIVTLRTEMLYGEWWENEELGFRVPDFLMENIRVHEVDFLAKYISAYIGETINVKSVEEVDVTYEDHKMTYYADLETIEGEEAVVEVDLDGVL